MHQRMTCKALSGLALMLAAAVAMATTPVPARSSGVQLIPAPVAVQPGQGEFLVDATIRVVAVEPVAAAVAAQFLTLLAKTTPLRLAPAVAKAASAAPAIRFRLAPGRRDGAAEGYALAITAQGVLVEAADARGLFYGAVSLWQLLSASPAAAVALPVMRIDDAPRFSWRGLMLDSARHFQSVDEIKSLLDAMALHKLNTFHWHLTDDQGWRIEIQRYPKLTEIGGCRHPAGEAGARAYCGFYTQAQIREVVAHAAALHITVVPEIDVPGHAQAAVAAYPEHGVVDGPTVPSHNWGVNPYLFNPREQTVRFLEEILDEVIALFPGQYIHIGGDEAVKYQWQASKQVQAQLRALGLANEEALQAHVLKRLERYLQAHGRKLIGWDEIIEGGLPPAATVMSWRGIDGGIEAARHGHDVVMAPGHTLYLDFLQTDSPDEPPGRPKFTSMQKIYAFDPVPEALNAEERKHVLGVQANVWTEHMRLFERVQHNVFPRMAALAEIAWTPPARKDYADFQRRLPAQLGRYRALGIPYAQTALSVALTRSDDRLAGTVTAALANPLGYADIRYTTDGSAPTAQSPAYTGPLTLPVPSLLKAAAFFDGRPLAAAASAWTLDADALLTRTDKTLAQCPDGGRLLLRLEDDGPLDGPRDSFDVTIFNPCWQWNDAQLDGIGAVRVRAGRIPYNFGLLREEEAKRGFRKPQAAHGEFELRAGCEGPLLASAPLPARADADGYIILQAPLAAAPGGRTDLCLRFSGDTRPSMWVLDQVWLLPAPDAGKHGGLSAVSVSR